MCKHAGKCVNGSSEVFNPNRRPWIDLSMLPAKEIAKIIEDCPSNALQYELKKD